VLELITGCARPYSKVIFVKIVDKIILTHLGVRDMDKSKAFYTDVLGFEATLDATWGKGNRGVFVVPPGGGTYLALDFISEAIKIDAGRIFFLSTSDVEAAYEAIKAKGVKPNSEIMPYPPGGRFFSVNDPDGNVWNILQS
jgi:predicted enzyme related to lactoylglutathione lyase